MNIKANIFLVVALFFLSFNIAKAADHDVCLLTDMSSDSDDIGALQLALYYHHIDRINLRCVITSSRNGQGHRVVRHLIEWWGYTLEDIPVGQNRENNDSEPAAQDGVWVNSYNDDLNTTNFTAQSGFKLLKSKLTEFPNMTVVEVGFPLTTYKANVRNSIKKYIQMGGNTGDRHEFNVGSHHASTRYIAERAQIDWYDFDLGDAIKTGQRSIFSGSHPVRKAYGDHAGPNGNKSFDLLAVLGAVTGSQYFKFQRGTFNFDGDNVKKGGVWSASNTGTHRRAQYKNGTDVVKNEINRILVSTPETVESRRTDGEKEMIFIKYKDLLIPVLKKD